VYAKLGESDHARDAFEQIAEDGFATAFDRDRIGVVRLLGLATLA
jgi:hypothetical protein